MMTTPIYRIISTEQLQEKTHVVLLEKNVCGFKLHDYYWDEINHIKDTSIKLYLLAHGKRIESGTYDINLLKKKIHQDLIYFKIL